MDVWIKGLLAWCLFGAVYGMILAIGTGIHYLRKYGVELCNIAREEVSKDWDESWMHVPMNVLFWPYTLTCNCARMCEDLNNWFEANV